MIELTAEQRKIIKDLYAWYKAPDKLPYITLGGYAGTGKTTLISIFRRALYKVNPKVKVAFCSYTGKATRVLKNKLIAAGSVFDQDSISTIHSLIYAPIVNGTEVIVGWKLKDELKYDLIIVDEASMVDFKIWGDLTSFRLPIIAVGDHGQLPPIQGSFNLMEKPVIKLEEIHRQAKNNPIIKLSVQARNEGKIDMGDYSDKVRKFDRADSSAQEDVGNMLESYTEETLVLCGYNSTRVKLNGHIRQSLGFDEAEPQPGDRVICLRNNHATHIYNGMVGTIYNISKDDDEWYFADIEMDDEAQMFKGLISAKQFNSIEPMNFTKDRSKSLKGDLFDFGYAITVHKAQGSQAKRVILFEERFKQMDDDMWRKWLYTAVTRAEEELYIIGQ